PPFGHPRWPFLKNPKITTAQMEPPRSLAPLSRTPMGTEPESSGTPGKIRWSDLPFGSEFSPSQIQLPTLLEFAHEHGGDWRAFEATIKAKYFGQNQTSDYNRGKLANNTKLGMIADGIIERDAKLTDFGKKLYQLR